MISKKNPVTLSWTAEITFDDEAALRAFLEENPEDPRLFELLAAGGTPDVRVGAAAPVCEVVGESVVTEGRTRVVYLGSVGSIIKSVCRDTREKVFESWKCDNGKSFKCLKSVGPWVEDSCIDMH